MAHLPELRFALGEPADVDTATIDNAASTLEAASFFIRKVGTDGLPHPPSGDIAESRQRPPRIA